MKKLFAIFLVLTMMFTLVACSGAGDSAGVLNGKPGGWYGDEGLKDAPAMDAPMGDDVLDAMPEEGEIDGIEPDSGSNNHIQSGLLTAGEWSDVKNQDFWTALLNREEWSNLATNRNLRATQIVTVKVVDEEGNPCFNAPVELHNNDGKVYAAKTNVNGIAYLFHGLNGKSDNVTGVKVNDKFTNLDGNKEITVVYENGTQAVEKLDLMLMVDTTGSMGDELRYLQQELKSMIERVVDADKTLSIRISVNFYRDEGDEYVVRTFEFTNDVNTAINQLEAQRSDGGGDYPEAVHKALDSIVNHEWREDAVQMCFFVLDAPPHTEQEIQSINSAMTNTVKTMAAQGIRLIPIASSGVNTETEFLLRSWAAMTGGTYTFLTDHSGIGGDHLEPTVGEYEVEKLNNLMVRLIREYCNLVQE